MHGVTLRPKQDDSNNSEHGPVVKGRASPLAGDEPGRTADTEPVSEATPEDGTPQHRYEGLPWFDRVWVALLLFVVLTACWRVVL